MFQHLLVGCSLDGSRRHDAIADVPDGNSVVVSSGDVQRLALIVGESRSQNLTFVSAKSTSALILTVEFLMDVSDVRGGGGQFITHPDIASDGGREHVSTADTDRQDVISVSLQASDELSGLQVPDVDFTTSATRVEEGAVDSQRKNGLAFLSSVIQGVEKINSTSALGIHGPEIDHTISTSRDQDLIAGCIRHDTLCQHHTIHIAIMSKVLDVVLINLENLTSSSMTSRKTMIRRSGSPDATRTA